MGGYDNKLFKSLEDIVGVNVDITESKKSLLKKEQTMFCSVIKSWDEAFQNSNRIFEETGIYLGDYEDVYLGIIEDLLSMLYPYKFQLIIWWIYERFDENGELCTLLTEDGKQHTLKTPLQLYKFIKKLKPKND